MCEVQLVFLQFRTQYIGLLTCPKLEVVKYCEGFYAKLRAKMILSVIYPRWQIKVLLRNLCDYVMFEFEVDRICKNVQSGHRIAESGSK